MTGEAFRVLSPRMRPLGTPWWLAEVSLLFGKPPDITGSSSPILATSSNFNPAVEVIETSIMDVLVLGAVAISVPGVILGLIYMNSPWMQRKYREWRFGKK